MTIVYQQVIYKISLDFSPTVLCVTLPCTTVLPAPILPFTSHFEFFLIL